LHCDTWQSSGTGAKKQSFAVPVQSPFVHVAFTMHKSVGVQLVPFVSVAAEQLWLCSSQLISSHSAGIMPQSFWGPPMHSPATQASSTVQNTPSSQATPSSLGTTVHDAVSVLHVAFWQSAVWMVEQSMPHGHA